MITDTEGKVALRYYQNVPRYFQVGKHEYVVSIQYNVAILFAYPEDIDALLGLMGGCCGKPKKGIFWLATERDMSVFNAGRYP